MWSRIADSIIKFRLPLMGVIAIITIMMGYYASRVEMSYEIGRTVPPDDPEMVILNNFKKSFGEDGNIMAVGLRDSAVFQKDKFNELSKLGNELRAMEGVNEVISLPRLRVILKDTVNTKFYSARLFPEVIDSQQQLDSLLTVAHSQRLYAGQLVNETNGSVILLVSVDKEYANSVKREKLTDQLVAIGGAFSKKTGIELRYAGLPFMRSVVAQQVKKELSMFTILSAVVTGLIMLVFFRSVRAVVFSMVMIGVLVVWTLGTIALLGFKITLLSGLIPPVIVTIGITNAIYLLNKYHVEYSKQKNKLEAIRIVVQKMGLATFLTNLTVAIGFLTLLSTDITILREFGIVAGINIIGLFVVSLVMIPGILSWLPEPSSKHLKHLTFPMMGWFVRAVDTMVSKHRSYIYISATVLTLFAVIGIMRLQSVSFMVDDIPEESQIKKDLKFFEANFSGVMPLEIEVDLITKRKRPLIDDINNLRAIDAFEASLDSVTVISRPLSIITLVKAARQAFYNNNPERYDLPATKGESAFILRYMRGQGQSDSSGISTKLLRSFVDSSYSKMSIKMQMADIGSKRMDSLVKFVIQPKADSLVVALKKNLKSEKDSVGVVVTGTSKLFIRGNNFLIANLTESLVWAFVLITLSMAFLFANPRMIIISLIPNMIALMITAGLMGYLHIPLKASTALIFSITFGISVDNSIRFLAKYRQELLATGFLVPKSVSESILETGKSIIYTSIALFAGFIIFAFSDFGGTIALGILTSTTLVISMFTNLILLPALILTFDKPKKSREELPIDDFDSTAYGDGEEIDLKKIKIDRRNVE